MIEVPINEDTVTLFYLSEMLNIDLLYLLVLYDKYGKDLFFFFYIFRGKNVKLPSLEKLNKIRDFALNYKEYIAGHRKPETYQKHKLLERLDEVMETMKTMRIDPK